MVAFVFFFFCCSNENLIKDIYLRQNMDDQGWVLIKLIAGFNKVSCFRIFQRFSFIGLLLLFFFHLLDYYFFFSFTGLFS